MQHSGRVKKDAVAVAAAAVVVAAVVTAAVVVAAAVAASSSRVPESKTCDVSSSPAPSSFSALRREVSRAKVKMQREQHQGSQNNRTPQFINKSKLKIDAQGMCYIRES